MKRMISKRNFNKISGRFLVYKTDKGKIVQFWIK